MSAIEKTEQRANGKALSKCGTGATNTITGRSATSAKKTWLTTNKMNRQEFGQFKWVEDYHYDTAHKAAQVLFQLMHEQGIEYRYRRDHFSLDEMGEMLHKGMELNWEPKFSRFVARCADLWFDIVPSPTGMDMIHRNKRLERKFKENS